MNATLEQLSIMLESYMNASMDIDAQNRLVNSMMNECEQYAHETITSLNPAFRMHVHSDSIHVCISSLTSIIILINGLHAMNHVQICLLMFSRLITRIQNVILMNLTHASICFHVPFDEIRYFTVR